MPRGRILLKSISESKKLSLLQSDGARLLYTWLIPHLDVNGCFSGDPKVINGKIFTRLSKDDKEIEDYLKDLEKNGLVMRYRVQGDIFLKVPDFKEKQPYLNPKREAKPTIPKFNQELLMSNSGVAQPQSKYNVKVKEKVNVKVKENSAATPQPPQEVFMESWGQLYKAETGHEYKADKKDFILVAGLIKKFSAEKVTEKAKMLYEFCRNRSAWFTKGGMADFTTGTLSSRWNSIIEGGDSNGKKLGISRAEAEEFIKGRSE